MHKNSSMNEMNRIIPVYTYPYLYICSLQFIHENYGAYFTN